MTFYTAGNITAHSLGRSTVMQAEFDSIEAGFAAVEAAGLGAATSATSLTIGTGSKVLILTTGSFAVGQFVVIASTVSPGNLMFGQVTAWVDATDTLTVDVSYVTGSGTIAAWTITLSPPGLTTFTAASTDTLTNKTISADSNTLSGIAASSFVLSNASGYIDGSAAAKVIAAGVVVGTTDSQTLTNKTLTSPILTTPDIGTPSAGVLTSCTG